jgi:hypothetical protein
MNYYLIFACGMFVGAFLGLLVAGLCIVSHDADRMVDEAERCESLKREMGVEDEPPV